MMIEPVTRRRRRRSPARVGLAVGALLVVAVVAIAGAALFAWPHLRVEPDGEALAHIVQPGFAGHVSSVVVRRPDGSPIPVEVRGGRLWPVKPLRSGERLLVAVTARRPKWAGWFIGSTARASLVVRAPSARLQGRWLEVSAGAPVVASFDTPVRTVVLRAGGHARTLHFARARANVDVGTAADGQQKGGSVMVSAVPRSWERLPKPTQLTWFPARTVAQALVEPAVGSTLAPDSPMTLTFSRPVRTIFGTSLPTITPAVPGRWSQPDTHTLSFRPGSLGYPLGAQLRIRLPAPVGVVRARGGITRTLGWEVRHGTILRLEQLLAQAGYLPLRWKPAATRTTSSVHTELVATAEPPAGRFRWRYRNTPPELRALWQTGRWNGIVRGAVMMFEHEHGLGVDGFVGPQVWHALLADTIAGRRRPDGYSYVYVHRSVPQSLTLWHNGRTVLRSPGNTGVPAAPTQLGSFPVFEHIPIGTMSGTNPDGSHYHDPGIRYISYFNHGEAIHAFPRSSFGTPQSLGCVELPLAAAAQVWPYTPIGTLVTVEN
jgi:hypothetical protein